MTIKELLKDLSRYNEDAEIYFKLVINEDDANLDRDLTYIGGISTGEQNDYPRPSIEIGFKE